MAGGRTFEDCAVLKTSFYVHLFICSILFFPVSDLGGFFIVLDSDNSFSLITSAREFNLFNFF